MLIDINTKDLKLKEGELLIFDGRLITAISKQELLKPLYTEIKNDKKRITDLEIKMQKVLKDVYDLKTLEATL